MKKQAVTLSTTRALLENVNIRLNLAFLGAGLLLIARIYRALAPSQVDVAPIAEAIAALLVATPVFYLAIKGLFAGGKLYVAEQLVSLAVLAAIAQGEFAAATLVPLFLLLGHVVEERSILGARRAISRLASLTSTRATLVEDDVTREVEAEALKPDDLVLVKPGDTFPADGTVSLGFSAVDQSPVTGESIPQDVGPGDEVFACTINMSGVLKVKITKVGNDTALGRVVALLEEASLSKPPVVQMMQKYASLYLPTVLSLALGVFLLTRTLDRAISVLVISCPCAFVLAGPAAIVAALAVASRHGILIKGARFLERMAEVNSLILDKTGTATLGQLVVTGLAPSEHVTAQELLHAAATGSSSSRHPVAKAISAAASQRGIEPATIISSTEFPGLGTEAMTADCLIRLGRRTWLESLGMTIMSTTSVDHDGSVTWVAQEEHVLGAIMLSDQARPEVASALRDLRNMGIDRVSMVTGDRKQVAEPLAHSLGIDTVRWELLPEDKLEVVKEERDKGYTVMVVGDGVNDALALAAGDVGVAMGAAGVQVAIESADVALMHNNLRALPTAVELSRKTRSTINMNVLLGGGYSVLMLTLAALGIINPIGAALLHNLGSLFVIINSSRLLRFDSPHL